MNLDLFNSRDVSHLKNGLSDFHNNFIPSFLQDLHKAVNNIINTAHNNTTFTLDRFEGDFAVCENRNTKEMIDIPINKMPKDAKEGVILKTENDKYIIDYQATRTAKDETKELMDKLWKDV